MREDVVLRVSIGERRTFNRLIEGRMAREYLGTRCRRAVARIRPRKIRFYSEELLEIAHRLFDDLRGPPPLMPGFKDGNKYDRVIRGWTNSWNDELQARNPLDPNLERRSSLLSRGSLPVPPVNRFKARGLMQVRDATQKILGDEKGERRITWSRARKDMANPTLNIAAGIRWLHYKKRSRSTNIGGRSRGRRQSPNTNPI